MISDKNFALLRLVAFMALLCCGIAGLCATGAQFATVNRLISEAKYEQAAAQLEKVLTSEPQNAQAETLLGIVRTKQDKLDQAEVLFVRAIEHAPKSAQAYTELGKLYEEHGNVEGAMNVYEKLLDEVQGSIAARSGLARLYQDQGQFAKSLSYAEEIPPAKRPWDLLPVMLSSYLSSQRSDDAQKLIGDVLKRVPTNSELAPRVADVFLSKGMVNDAAEFFDSLSSKYVV